jgi:hypothetical protein
MLDLMVSDTKNDTFLYLGSMLQKGGGDIDKDVSHKIKVGHTKLLVSCVTLGCHKS